MASAKDEGHRRSPPATPSQREPIVRGWSTGHTDKNPKRIVYDLLLGVNLEDL